MVDMSPSYRNTAASRAASAIVRQHRNAAREQPLPSIRSLAVQYLVSPSTVVRALKLLQQRGLLRSKGRRRWLAGGTAGAETEIADPCTQGFERLGRYIEDDIMRGEFRSHRFLPSRKELCHRYGVHRRTLNKALELVRRSGLIAYSGSRYVLTSHQRSASGLTLAVVVRHHTGGTGLVRSLRQIQALHELEHLCASRNIALVYRRAHYIHGQGMFYGPEASPHVFTAHTVKAVDAVLVIASGLLPAGYIRTGYHYGTLASELARWRLPCILLAEGDLPGLESCRVGCPMKVLRVGYDSAAPGAILRHLVERGHRTIAFVGERGSAVHGTRFEQCVRAATAIDRGVSIAGYTVDSDACRRRWAGDMALHPAIPGDTDKRGMCGPGRMDNTCAGRLFEAMDRAYREGISAVVGGDDSIALAAYHWALERRTAVPGNLSIAGFDNSLSAAFFGITSYDYNMPAYAHTIVESFLHPRRGFTRPFFSGYEDLSGFLVRRESTAPVPA